MIVYQALSTYQILECIEHKKIYHENDEAVLILGTYIIEKFPNYKDLETYGFFKTIYLFNFGGTITEKNKIVEIIGNRMKETFDFDICKAEKIYIAGIHTYLSAYLIEKEIKFSMFEDGSGALSRPWVLADITKKSAPDKYKILNEYGLYNHSSEFIVEKWCNMNTQLSGFCDNKMHHFDVVDGFEELTENQQKNLLQFFGIDKKIELPKNCTLLLTQQFSNLGQLSFEEHILIYQYLFDFYLNSNTEDVIIKLHPDDIMYYKKLFNNVSIIDKKFPAELLPYVFEKIPNRVATISSTGIHLIKSKFNSILEFNELYEMTFKYDPIYYVVIQVLKRLNCLNIYYCGINIVQLKNMMKDFDPILRNINDIDIDNIEESNNNILIVDDLEDVKISALEKFDRIIYINDGYKYQMYDYKKSDFLKLVPVNIQVTKKINWDNGLQDMEHTIWIKVRKNEDYNMLDEFKLEKEMKNTGCELSAETAKEYELEIKRLRGLLEATERRLLDYIKREKTLMEQIEEMK